MNALLALLLLVSTHGTAALPNIDRQCLAMVAYTEARGEGVAGMAAVEQVVMNRVADRRWPGGVCAVVFQPRQFEGVSRWHVPAQMARSDAASWSVALELSGLAQRGVKLVPDECRGATYFDSGMHHKRYQPVCRIGGHTFYVDHHNQKENNT